MELGRNRVQNAYEIHRGRKTSLYNNNIRLQTICVSNAVKLSKEALFDLMTDIAKPRIGKAGPNCYIDELRSVRSGPARTAQTRNC